MSAFIVTSAQVCICCLWLWPWSITTVLALTSIFPVVDLNYIRAVCEDYGHDVDKQIDAVNLCLQLIPEQLTGTAIIHANPNFPNEAGSDFPVIECKYSNSYLRCYAFATDILNTCEEGRGDVLRRIHEAVHAQMCADGGVMLKSALRDSGGSPCAPSYNTTAECISDDAYDAWDSDDVCTSFNALLSCQVAALIRSAVTERQSECADLPLTQLIVQRLREAGRELNCVGGGAGAGGPSMVMDDPDPDATTAGPFASLFPNPRQELMRLRLYCETQTDPLVTGVQSSLDEARRCLDQELQNESALSQPTGPRSRDKCQAIQARNKCWNPITAKLNECIRGRGTVVTKIYTEMVRVACLKRAELKELPVTEKCVADSAVPACKDVTATNNGDGGNSNAESEDLCSEFQSKRACVQKAIGGCTYETHKHVLESTLEQVENNLGCDRSAVPTDKDENGGSSPVVPAGFGNGGFGFGAHLKASTSAALFAFVCFCYTFSM